jgi:hypothetical protein
MLRMLVLNTYKRFGSCLIHGLSIKKIHITLGKNEKRLNLDLQEIYITSIHKKTKT